jgi:hypothetical protein
MMQAKEREAWTFPMARMKEKAPRASSCILTMHA